MIRSRTHILLLAAPAFLYLLLLAAVAALYLHPPALGWIGLGVVALVAPALTAAAVVLFPRMRSNPARPARPRAARVLVLADAACTPDALCETIAAHVAPAAADVLVVSPVLASPLHYLSGDEEHERAAAQARLDAVVAALAARDVHARGELGADDPLQALDDTAPRFAATEIVLATSSTPHWLETDVVEHARTLAPTVEHVVATPS
jgi:hypothetical protein